MIAIAHFATGMAAALVLLIWYPALVAKYIGNLVKNDLFFVLGSGFFAMLPDLNKIIISPTLDKLHGSAWSNIFWGHHFLDTFADAVQYATVPIAIAIILAYYYLQTIK